jgi:YaiO family outer membrane protein
MRYYCIVVASFVALSLVADLSSAQEVSRPNKDSTFVASEFSYVDFRGDIDPWRLASLSVGGRTRKGSVIGRVNYANRFATNGMQVEADAYPRLSARTYAYLNAGYSDAAIFPKWRVGGELFSTFPSAWEGSVGFRQLRFGGPPVTLVTGSLGKYVGNYWASVRPYFRFQRKGTSTSVGITARRYFADGDHFVGFRAGYGTTPSDQITPDQLARTSSYSADAHGSGGPWRRAVATWALGFGGEKLAGGQVRKSYTGTVGVKAYF